MAASRSNGWCPAVVFALLVAAVPRDVSAQQQPTDPTQATTTFATLPAPTGIMVATEGDDSRRDVLVLSDPPTGTTLAAFDPDGTKLREQPLQTTPPDRLARSRLARIERGPFLGLVALSGAGILHVELEQLDEAIELDLATIEPLEAPDLDADGAAAQLSFTGAQFHDVATVPGLPAGQRPGTQPTFDVFVTGVTAPAAGARPFLLRVEFEPPDTATIRALVTTQGTVADPEHRSGVGTFIPPSDAPAPDRPAVVLAALPTRASSSNPAEVDTLVSVGADWPEDTSAEPPGIVLDEGQPVTLTSRGMTNDQEGNLYAILAADACSPDGGPSGPGVAVLTTSGDDTEELCLPLPPPTGQGAAYVDVAVGEAGDPVYVTNDEGGVVLRLPGIPVTTGTPGNGPRTALGAAARSLAR